MLTGLLASSLALVLYRYRKLRWIWWYAWFGAVAWLLAVGAYEVITAVVLMAFRYW